MRIRSICSIGLACSLIVGCNFAPQIANDAIDYNLAFEEANNELLLLNIVRAYRGYPMYFSGITNVTGSLQFNSKASLEIPTGGDAENVYPLNPEVSYQSSPSFEVGVLDNKEFIQGILSPISEETLEYYWHYNWPKEMLIHLFVEKVDLFAKKCDSKSDLNDFFDFSKERFYDTYEESYRHFIGHLQSEEDYKKNADSCIITVPNEPNWKEGFVLFQKLIRDFDFSVTKSKQDGVVGRNLTLGNLAKIQNIVAAPDQKLTLSSSKGSEEGGKSTFDLKNKKRSVDVAFGKTKDGELKNFGRIYLRSPQAILFYLGEVLQVTDEEGHSPVTIMNDMWTKFEPLLHVEKETNLDREEGAISVVYRDRRYFVPDCANDDRDDSCEKEIGHTLTVFTLVNQLIGQQKSADSLPGSRTVRLIGN